MKLRKFLPGMEFARSPPKKLAVTYGTVHLNGSIDENAKGAYHGSLSRAAAISD